MLDPQHVINLTRTVRLCSVDRKTRIVMRQRKAVSLGWTEFAVFYALHSRKGKKALTHTIYEDVYRGQIGAAINVIAQVVRQVNFKLLHIGLKIEGTNKRQNSFYEIVPL